ncbi:MAG TPA: type 1 glutamine amidotransferase domain-containing protein [Allosphingosinicella sp.]|jgi:protease I|nr:type 1 glutamine amidotransferase domain-containing protein [Allosphingosinicella sp.]
MPKISDTKILLIATDGYEDSELLETRRLLEERGADVTLASPKMDEIKGDKGATTRPDILIDQVDASRFDALVLPGGVANPDKLRMNEKVVETVGTFVRSGRPVGAICHGPWLLAEADVLKTRKVTSWPSIRTDLRNAGAEVVDQEAVIDGNIVTSRKPDDIPAFVDAVVQVIEKAHAPAMA